MAYPMRSNFPVLLFGAGVLVIAGCSEPSGSLDHDGLRASAQLVADPPLQMVSIQDAISPAQLAGFIGYYAPGQNAPDHELRWIRTETGPLREIQSTIRRHGAWVRRDWTDKGLTNTEVIHLSTGITVSEARDAAGAVVMHSIRAPRPDTGASATYVGRPTGERQERQGEPCADHVVYWVGQARRIACVTADGISVSEHTEGANGEAWPTSVAFAARLTRRAIASDLMQPPSFDRNAWLGNPAADAVGEGENYTVLLEAQQGDIQYLMRRRRGWTGEEMRSRDGSATIWAQNRAQGRWVVARLGAGARPEEVTYGSHRTTGPGEGEPVKLERPGETILGLACTWYDVMPNVEDAGRHECRTSNGTPLRIQKIGRGSIRIDAVATRVDRMQSATADVLPPQAWSSPRRWGVPAPGR